MVGECGGVQEPRGDLGRFGGVEAGGIASPSPTSVTAGGEAGAEGVGALRNKRENNDIMDLQRTSPDRFAAHFTRSSAGGMLPTLKGLLHLARLGFDVTQV